MTTALGAEIICIVGPVSISVAPPTGGSGKALSGSQHKILAEQLSTKKLFSVESP